MKQERQIGPVSVVVCNYNGERYLSDCMDSILALDPGPDEIVVVDNGSTDQSLQILRTRFPDVQVLELIENGGPCVARNEGMRVARNRWVFAVDNDAILRPDVLGKLIQVAEAFPAAVVVQPRSLLDDERTRVHYDGACFHYAGLFALRNFYRPLAEAEGEGVLAVDGAVAIALLLDRDRVFEVGGYDEDFFILFEDYDLSLRLRIAGHEIYSREDAIVLHRGGTPGISFREGMEYPSVRAFYHSRNRWLLLIKNHALWTLVVSLPGLVLYELAWFAFTLSKGHARAWGRGKLAFVRALPKALEQRRSIQAARRTPDREMLVGGPVTLSPELVQRPLGRLGARLLDAGLRAWWSVARLLVR